MVGGGEADITPPGPVYLSGFNLGRVSTGVRDPLRARAMVIVAGDLRVAIVGIDNLGLQRDDTDWIKTALPGFANGCVFLCSSHTHAGPDPVGIWGQWYWTSGRDPHYVAQVRAGVAQAVAQAESRLRPAELWRGEARLPRQGLVKNSNRPELFDPTVTVVQARDAENGEPLAALLHMACHPEVFGRRNTLITADFVGGLCDRWLAEGLGQPVFVNGALGAMITPQPRDEQNFAVMVDGSYAVCRAALEGAQRVPGSDIEVRRQDLYLPLTSPGLALGRLTMVIPRRAYGDRVRTTVGYLRLGSVEIACVPGEMEPTLAARLRQATLRPDMLLFGLVDDELGYLMRTADARDPLFDYERLMSPCVDAGEQVVATLAGVTASR